MPEFVIVRVDEIWRASAGTGFDQIAQSIIATLLGVISRALIALEVFRHEPYHGAVAVGRARMKTGDREIARLE